MSDSEDDYMSDKLLMDVQEDIRPGLAMNVREKRKLDVFKKKEDQKNKRPKPLGAREREVREQGLKTAIPSDNKGFKLLEKMGFKPGEGLGKSQSGLKEPINIVVREGTSGVGRQNHEKEMIVKRRENRFKRIRDCENKFRVTNREKTLQWTIRKDFFKAQRICEELDFRNSVKDPVADFFWTKDTIKKRRRKESDSTEDEEDSEDEEFENYICEDNLFCILNYLRKKHLYCMYCVITGSNEEDLKENCPGPFRIDHDSEYD